MRYSLMGVSGAAAAVLAVAALLRAAVKPGKVRQGELDEMEAKQLAKAALAELKRSGHWAPLSFGQKGQAEKDYKAAALQV